MNYRQSSALGLTAAMAFALACAAKGGSGGNSGKGGTAGSDQGGAAGAGDQGGGSAGEAQGGSNAGGKGGSAGNGGAGSGGTAGAGAGAGGAAGGGAGGAMAGTCASRPYCNDFEAAMVGATPAGSRVSNGNTLKVANDKAASGKNSLAGTASNGEARLTFMVPAGKWTNPKKVTYLRMKMWLEGLPGGDGHWDIMAVTGAAKQASGGNFQATVSFGGSGDLSTRMLYLGGGSDCAKSARPLAIPMGRWACFEFQIDETVVGSEFQVSLDGTPLDATILPVMDNGAVCTTVNPNMNNWYVPSGNVFSVGWQYYHTQAKPVKFWIDDVVADQVPIGCN